MRYARGVLRHDLIKRLVEKMAAFLARLWRAAGNECPEGPTEKDPPFTDVPASSFAADDIVCIWRLGITTGTSFTTYSPEQSVTREQMAAFLGRLIRLSLGLPQPG